MSHLKIDIADQEPPAKLLKCEDEDEPKDVSKLLMKCIMYTFVVNLSFTTDSLFFIFHFSAG